MNKYQAQAMAPQSTSMGMSVMKQSTVDATPVSWKFNLSISEPIESTEQFADELSVLRNATQNDVVHMLINSPGGNIFVANEIMNAMDACRGHIITEIVGECCSAATSIFLKGEERRVNRNAFMMFHTATHGYWGSNRDVYNHAVFMREWLSDLSRNEYRGFLTEEEIDDICEARKEIWMNAEEIARRLDDLDGDRFISISRDDVEGLSTQELLDMLFPMEGMILNIPNISGDKDNDNPSTTEQDSASSGTAGR